MYIRSLVLIAAAGSGCAAGYGRVTASPHAAHDNRCEGYVVKSYDSSGYSNGYRSVGGGADEDTSDTFHIGLQAGARVGQIGGNFGDKGFAHGWSYDAHADIMGSAGGVGFGLTAGYLIQNLDYGPTVAGTSTMRDVRGYVGPTLGVLGAKSLGGGWSTYGIVSAMLGSLAMGNENKNDEYGTTSAKGARAQAGFDYEWHKSCSVGIGWRFEAGVEKTGSGTVMGKTGTENGSVSAGTIAAEIYAAFNP